MATPARQTAADVMTPTPRSCSPFSSVVEAVMIFRDADCGSVPVVDAGKPVGVLTDRDVALALAEYPDLASRAVADIMSKNPITVTPDATREEIEATMTDHAVRRVLVADRDGSLVGIVSWKDIAPSATDREVGQVVSDVVTQP